MDMQLYLMQHGEAFSKDEDPDRHLTDEGARQIERSAVAIRRLGIRFDAVLCSPGKRSRQTAEIVANLVGVPSAALEETESVKGGAEARQTVECLQRFDEDASVLITGHMPNLAKLASFLLADRETTIVQFRNGGLCRLSCATLAGGEAELVFCMTPMQLTAIAGSS